MKTRIKITEKNSGFKIYTPEYKEDYFKDFICQFSACSLFCLLLMVLFSCSSFWKWELISSGSGEFLTEKDAQRAIEIFLWNDANIKLSNYNNKIKKVTFIKHP